MNRLEEVMGSTDFKKREQGGQTVQLEFTYAGKSVVVEAGIHEPFISAVKRASDELRLQDRNVFIFVRGQPIQISASDTVYQTIEKHRSTAFGIGPHGNVGGEKCLFLN